MFIFRTIALSLYLMSARAGIMIGNIVFPYLLKSGCLPPFLVCGLAIIGKIIKNPKNLNLNYLFIGCFVLTTLYPSTENKALK